MPHEMEENGAEVSDPMSENEDETESFVKNEKMADQGTTDNTAEVKKKYDPKDPLRPRRKKARRACFACQRAHLTCGKSSCRPSLCFLSFARCLFPLREALIRVTLRNWRCYSLIFRLRLWETLLETVG
jgi:hypothetical protein